MEGKKKEWKIRKKKFELSYNHEELVYVRDLVEVAAAFKQ